MTSSRLAFGSGARFGAVRRRVCGVDVRVLRSLVLRAGARVADAVVVAVAVAVAVAPAAVVFLRLRPPRVPRRRFFAAASVLDCPSSPADAGLPTVRGSGWGVSGARVSGATSSGFLRRNHFSGKRCLL